MKGNTTVYTGWWEGSGMKKAEASSAGDKIQSKQYCLQLHLRNKFITRN